jgi:hypothetical protein
VEEESIILLEDAQASPICPSDVRMVGSSELVVNSIVRICYFLEFKSGDLHDRQATAVCNLETISAFASMTEEIHETPSV